MLVDMGARYVTAKSPYVNRPKSSSMSCCHVLVKCLYRIRPGHLPIFLIHIMRSGARVVADPDPKVLDLLWALLMYLDREMYVSHRPGSF